MRPEAGGNTPPALPGRARIHAGDPGEIAEIATLKRFAGGRPSDSARISTALATAEIQARVGRSAPAEPGRQLRRISTRAGQGSRAR